VSKQLLNYAKSRESMMEELFNDDQEIALLLEELTEIIESDCQTASRSIKQVKNVVYLAKAKQAGRV